MAIPQIPDILTRRHWQSHKGKIAKMTGETGVGDAMEAVQAAYDAVDWRRFDVNEAVQGAALDLSRLDAAFARARAEYPKVTTLRERLFALRDVANAAAEKFRGKRLVPASSRRHATAVGVAAEHFAIELRSLGDAWQQRRGHIVVQLGRLRGMLPEMVANVGRRADKILAMPEPTRDQFREALLQKCRAVAAQINVQLDLKRQLHADWYACAQLPYYDDIADGDAVKAKARYILAVVKKSLVVLAMPAPAL